MKCRYGSCLANSTLKCPMNYSTGVGQAFGPVGVELSNDNCGRETLDEANWKVEVIVCKHVMLCS